jgi:hypothetical protein
VVVEALVPRGGIGPLQQAADNSPLWTHSEIEINGREAHVSDPEVTSRPVSDPRAAAGVLEPSSVMLSRVRLQTA